MRSKHEVYLIYDKRDDRYYVYDGETYEYDIKGRESLVQALHKFWDLVEEAGHV